MNRFLKFVIVLAVAAGYSNAYAFTSPQARILDIAYVEGLKIGYPETIQSICIQETLAGVLGPVGDKSKKFGLKSYGVMQIKVATAKDVILKHPKLKAKYRFLRDTRITDEEILVNLIINDRFNIEIGTLYFEYLVKRAKHRSRNWSRAVLEYNRGPSGIGDPNEYVKKIRMHLNSIRIFNLSHHR